MSDSALDTMLDEIYGRVGEVAPQPRLSATRKALELMGDPQRAYPIVHITGTNGKTSTSRITESILRAHGLRTGLFTSPDLGYLGDRIVVDGEPIDREALLAAWSEVKPYLALADAELAKSGEPPLTFFEALTVLAYSVFADAPIDVGVIEVGMGGEWDSTNVADGQVAVFAPIDLDHTQRLGSTVAEIARTKAGIIKPGRSVVSAAQAPEALAELERAAELSEADITLEGRDFRVLARTPAVGGQIVDVQGRAGRYTGLFVPLLGAHQAQNTAVAIVAVETFLGDGTQPITGDVLAEGLAAATSPGRLQVVGSAPVLVVDAAHNPHGVRAMAVAVAESFRLRHVVAVVAVLGDKDADGIIRAAADLVDEFVITTAPSARSTDPDELAAVAVAAVGADRVVVEPDLARALETARDLAVDHASSAPPPAGRGAGEVLPAGRGAGEVLPAGRGAGDVLPAGRGAGDVLPAGRGAGDVLPAGRGAGDVLPAGRGAGDVLPAGRGAGDVLPAGRGAGDVLPAGRGASDVPPAGRGASDVPPAGRGASEVPPAGRGASEASLETTPAPERSGVVVFGSITLVAEVLTRVRERGWS